MTRHGRLKATAASACIAGAIIAISAAVPGNATLICSSPKDPTSCVNVPPIASTTPADRIGGRGARLNGVVGPGVPNGDPVSYFFRFGRTKRYGKSTPKGTFGHCPPGTAGNNYCQTPASKWVWAKVRDLRPCTEYHYNVVADSLDGTTVGLDQKFKTGFDNPVMSVSAPSQVSAGRTFIVQLKTRPYGKITITLRLNGQIVKTVKLPARKGVRRVAIVAPSQGNYVLTLEGSLSCGRQSITRQLVVTE